MRSVHPLFTSPLRLALWPLLTLVLCCWAYVPMPSPVDAASSESTVPPPFEALRLPPNPSPDALEVEVWGRRYQFGSGSGPVPLQIHSQGRELLAMPISLRMRTSGAQGALEFSGPRIVERAPEGVTFDSSARQGRARIEARTRIEYDGMIRVDLVVTAEEALQIDGFSYDIRLAGGVGQWFNVHVPYDYKALNVDKLALLDSAGLVPDQERGFDFAPTFFLGNREVGIEWWSETDLDWSVKRGARPLRLVRDGDSAKFGITPISAPVRLAKGESWSDTFALFPAPMRPPPDHWRSRRFIPYHSARRFKQGPGLEYYWITFPVHFQARHHGLPQSMMNREQQELRARIRSVGVRYIPYGKLTAVPSMHPLAMAKQSEWAANDQNWVAPPPGEAKLLRRTTRWKPRQPYGYAACAGRWDYLEWILSENVKALQEEELDGLYFDHGAISRMCTKDPRLAQRRGRKDAQIWHYFNVRRFYKELYEQMKRTRPGALLTIHTHGQPRALAAWADYNFIGEGLNVPFRKSRAFIKSDAYDPDYLGLPPGWLEAQVFPRIGGITSILPQLKNPRNPDARDHIPPLQRALFSWVLLNDVHVWLANGDFEGMIDLIAQLDTFGSLDEAQLLPWWQGGGVSRKPAGLEVTTYARGDTALLVVSNLGPVRRSGRIELDGESLPTQKLRRLRNLERGGSTQSLRGGGFEVSVPSHDYRLFLVSP